VTVTAGTKTDSITITVQAATVPATGVTINGGNRTMTVGQNLTLTCTVQPPNSTDVSVWSASPAGIITINPGTGYVTAVAPGTATVTVTAGTKTHSVTITVNPAGDPDFPLKNGEGPYTARADDEGINDFRMQINMENFNNPIEIIPTSYKLKDILNTNDLSGISVRPANPALNGNFEIKEDRDGDLAIFCTYYGTKDKWDEAVNRLISTGVWTPPTFEVQIVLEKSGFNPATIKVLIEFYDALYG